jgi:hypothetical protein
MKYAALYGNLYSLFATPAWQAEAINTFPENFVGDGGTEYIRVSIVAGDEAINSNSVSGQIQIEIFVPAGYGPTRATQIADKLEQYLVGKTFRVTAGKSTQFFPSNLAGTGSDRDNPALYRMLYTLPFKHFGV